MNDSEIDVLIQPVHLPLAVSLLFEAISALVFVLSAVCNVLLIIVSMKERNNDLAVYTRVFVQNCIVDLAFCFTTYFFNLNGAELDNVAYYMLKGPLSSSTKYIQAMQISSCVLVFQLASTVIPVTFFFRYCLLVRKRQLRFFELNVILLIMLVQASVVAGLNFISLLREGWTASPKCCAYKLRNELWTLDILEMQSCLLIRKTSRMENGFFMAHNISSMVVLALILLMAISIYLETRRNAKFIINPRTKELQRQLNAVLLGQSVLPICFICFPVLLVLINLGLNVGLYGVSASMQHLNKWVSLINPCVTLVIIHSFRQRCLHFLYRIISNRSTTLETHSNNFTVSIGI